MASARKLRQREDDPRFQRSLKAIDEAAAALIDRQAIGDISITGLVADAGVTRPTFYQHYPDVKAVARAVALARLADAFPKPEPLSEEELASVALMRARIATHMEPVLGHLDTHRAFYLRVLDGAADVEFFEAIVALVIGRMLPEAFAGGAQDPRTGDLMATLAGGAMWLTIRWLRGDMGDESPADMAGRIADITTMVARPAG